METPIILAQKQFIVKELLFAKSMLQISKLFFYKKSFFYSLTFSKILATIYLLRY